VSTCSFHATKLFHTGEGGAIYTGTQELYNKLFYHHNFGHDGPLDFHGLGINAKMSELQAAMGLSVLPYLQNILEDRKKAVQHYLKELKGVQFLKLREGTNWNYAYFPVIFENEINLFKVQESLNDLDIYPRRYFYPSLNFLNYVDSDSLPISESFSKCILCLPLYFGILVEELDKICNTINKSIC
jgi:dTDP-4-amino-4,6-dideoxygalactose transaminase